MNKAKKMQFNRSVGTASVSIRKKYFGLILSIALFLALIIALLILNNYASRQTNLDTQSINLSAKIQNDIQNISRTLYDLKLNEGEEPFGQHVVGSVKSINANSQSLSNTLNIFLNGGTVTQADGQALEVPAIRDPLIRKNLEEADSEWQSFNKTVQSYTENAFDIKNDGSALDLAVVRSLSSAPFIYLNLSDVSNEIAYQAQKRAKWLELAQIIGIALAILYFVVFIFFFVRRLKNSDIATEAAKNEITKILETVNDGLFLLDQDLLIGSEHSNALSQILNNDHIAGQKFDKLIATMVAPKTMEVTTEYITQLFNPKVKAKLIHDLNPLDRVHINIKDKNGQIKERYLKFSFSRVYQGQSIEQILVSVADISKTVLLEQRLERERVENDEQVEMLTAILKVDERMIKSFLRNTSRTIDKINGILRDPTASHKALQSKARTIFREAHSLKGDASALGLQVFVHLAEELENNVKPLAEQPKLVGNDFIPTAVALEQLMATHERVDDLVKKIGGFSTPVDSKEQGDTLSGRRRLSSNYDQYFQEFAQQIAERNHKKIDVDVAGFDTIDISEEQQDLLKDLTIQLIRNAIVHGIEEPDVRRSKNKSEVGHLSLRVSENSDGHIELSVADDGQGINYPAIRNSIKVANRLTDEEARQLTLRDLHAAMFKSGFTTQSKVSEDAGQGVGSDVIKARLRELRGKIGITSELNQSTQFLVQFPK